MSNEANSNKIPNHIPLPRIEKPAIRIDLGIKLNELDKYVASIAAILSPKEYGDPDILSEELKYDPIDLPPISLKILRMQYLEVDDISPVLDFTRDDSNYDFISLIYQANKDLTMRELDEFLTSVTNKLHTVIAVDLKRDLSHSIKRILVLGSRKRIVRKCWGL